MATDAGTSSVPTVIVSAPASAATSPSYPPCAQTCLAEATGSLPCAESDSICLCLHASIVETSVTSCLNSSGACSAGEATSAARYYNDRCLRLGLPISEDQSAVIGPIVTATGNPTRVSTHLPAASESEHSSSNRAASSHGLSVPAIAGIAAGAAFLVVCVMTFLAFIYIRKRSKTASNPTVTIESLDPSNPNNRLRKTVSLRQSALYDPDDPEWRGKLSSIRTLMDDDKKFEHELCHIERKRSLPQTPNTPISPAETLTNNSFTFYKEDFDSPLPALPPAAKISSANPSPQQPRPHALERSNRPPSITFLPSKSIFEANVTVQSLPGSRRISVDQKSPAVTVFSDAASFHNTPASHSRATSRDTVSEFSDEDATDFEVAQVSVMQRSRPTTFIALAAPAEYTSSIANTNTKTDTDTDYMLEPPARPVLLSKFSSDTTIPSHRTAKPAPLTLNPNTTSTSFMSLNSRHATIHPKMSQNSLSQNPSPTTPTHPRSPLSPLPTSTSDTPSLPSTPIQPFTFRPTSSQLATPTHSYMAPPTQRSPPANMSLFPRSTTTNATATASANTPSSLTLMNITMLGGYTRSTALDPGQPAYTDTPTATASSMPVPAPPPSPAPAASHPTQPPDSNSADANTPAAKILSASSFGKFDFELLSPNFSDDFDFNFDGRRT